jgi:hydrogenase nickel incorporation protein HypB
LTMKIEVLKDVLAANETISVEIESVLSKHKVLAVNVMSSPGSGKTKILEKTIEALKPSLRAGVIAGDVSTTRDAERLSEHTKSVVQIDTDAFGGKCHLEAQWVKKALSSFDLSKLDLLFVENVGNLICPTGFNLGEKIKVVVLSVTEGEDKPLKYPSMFSIAHAVIVNKIDLLPHLDFDMDALRKNLKDVAPRARVFELSASSGEGMDGWIKWLSSRVKAVKEGVRG